MDNISVIVVDDNEVDRYIVRRKLAKTRGFSIQAEMEAGDQFLSDIYPGQKPEEEPRPPLLVLMDINMPRLDGFETVTLVQQERALQHGPQEIVIIMYSSSAHPLDVQRATDLELVRGYIQKPFDEDDVEKIRGIYKDLLQNVILAPVTPADPAMLN